MCRYGLLTKKWFIKRQQLVEQFQQSLAEDLPLFNEFFIPGEQEFGDGFDWQLKQSLDD
jgi:hypothetical protein